MDKRYFFSDYSILLDCVRMGATSQKMLEEATNAILRYKDLALGGHDDNRPPCKCQDNNRIDGHAFFIKRISVFSINERSAAYPVKFNYCPECGRKL